MYASGGARQHGNQVYIGENMSAAVYGMMHQCEAQKQSDKEVPTVRFNQLICALFKADWCFVVSLQFDLQGKSQTGVSKFICLLAECLTRLI